MIRARPEQRRVEVVELVDRLLEEAPLAHHAFGIQRPALAEVGRREDLAARPTGCALRITRCQWWPGIGLVDRGRRDRPVGVVRQPRLDLLLRGAVGRERHEEVALPAVRERRRRDVRRDAEDRALEHGRRDDGAPLARGQRDQARLGAGSRGPSRSTPRRPGASPARSAGGRLSSSWMTSSQSALPRVPGERRISASSRSNSACPRARSARASSPSASRSWRIRE